MGLLRAISSALGRVDERLDEATSLASRGVVAAERLVSFASEAVAISKMRAEFEGYQTAACAISDLSSATYESSDLTPQQRAVNRMRRDLAIRRLSSVSFEIPLELRQP